MHARPDGLSFSPDLTLCCPTGRKTVALLQIHNTPSPNTGEDKIPSQTSLTAFKFLTAHDARQGLK